MRKLYHIFIFVFLIGCNDSKFKPEWTKEQSPETFRAKFETTKGDFEIEVNRSLSPHAADRFYQLVKHGYYDNAIFYRVVPGFVAQFGNTDTATMERWRSVKVPDEKVIAGNKRGSISFARSGKETRDLEIFINLQDNPVLDTLNFEGITGFPSFGYVTKGIEVVDGLYSGYGETTMDNPNLYANRSVFYKTYPKLDLIKKAYLTENE